MAQTQAPTERKGFFRRVPILGTIIRDCEKDVDSVIYLIVGIISLLLIGTFFYGLPVIAIAAVIMVPVIFTCLILITRG